MGAFNFNPKAEYNGDFVELQPLGTEGQGSALNSSKKYARTQFTMPIGLGFRVTLGDVATLNIEYGIRKTFTDSPRRCRNRRLFDLFSNFRCQRYCCSRFVQQKFELKQKRTQGNSTTSDWYALLGLC